MTYRFRFKKYGTASFISHLELGKVIERSFRRGKVAVEYSEGFNPHMKLSFGPALALGCESDGEYIDINLAEQPESAVLLQRINACTPQGIEFVAAEQLSVPYKSLGSVYTVARYEAIFNLVNMQAGAFEAFVTAEQWPYEKISPKGRKIVDVKMLLADKPLLTKHDGDVYRLQFAVFLDRTGGTIKPAEFVTAVLGNAAACSARYRRVQLCSESKPV